MTPIPALRPAPAAVGVFAQATAEVVLTRMGFQLALPRDACLAFDLLVSRDGALSQWYKVQVKQASRGGTVGLRRGSKRRGCPSYVAGDFDLLVVVDDGSGTFVIPYLAIQRRTSRVCVRTAPFVRYRVASPTGEVAFKASLAAALAVGPEPEQLCLFGGGEASGRTRG